MHDLPGTDLSICFYLSLPWLLTLNRKSTLHPLGPVSLLLGCPDRRCPPTQPKQMGLVPPSPLSVPECPAPAVPAASLPSSCPHGMGTPVHAWADKEAPRALRHFYFRSCPSSSFRWGRRKGRPCGSCAVAGTGGCSPFLQACVWGEEGSGSRTCSVVCASFQVSQSR